MKSLIATFGGAVAEARAKKGAFVLDVVVMALNNVMWIAFWIVLFSKTGAVRDWDVDRVLMLFAVVTGVYGLSNGLLPNARRIGEMASDGRLDSVLTLPVDVLGHLLARKFNPSGLGDLAFGIGLFFIVGDPTPIRTVAYFVVITLGAAVLTSFLVLLSASAMLFGGRGHQGPLGFDMSITLSMYPFDFFGAGLKLVLYTAVPTAFIAAAPADLMTQFTWARLFVLVTAAVVSAALARLAFNAGLRNYHSGSRWTQA